MNREDVSALVALLVRLGYGQTQRAALLSGVEPGVIGGLRELGRPKDQALSDVQMLLGFGPPGEVALGQLLRNALDVATVASDRDGLMDLYEKVTGERPPVGSPRASAEPGPRVRREGGVKTILFIGANPVGSRHLRIDQEMAEIQREINQAPEGRQLTLVFRFATTFREVQAAILDVQPDFVHFSCHGEAGKLVLADAANQRRAIAGSAIVRLVCSAEQPILGCLLIACDSAQIAEEMVQPPSGSFAVGMRGPISDQAARAYLVGFYLTLARGRPAELCHEQGVIAIMALDVGEEGVPELFGGAPVSPSCEPEPDAAPPPPPPAPDEVVARFRALLVARLSGESVLRARLADRLASSDDAASLSEALLRGSALDAIHALVQVVRRDEALRPAAQNVAAVALPAAKDWAPLREAAARAEPGQKVHLVVPFLVGALCDIAVAAVHGRPAQLATRDAPDAGILAPTLLSLPVRSDGRFIEVVVADAILKEKVGLSTEELPPESLRLQEATETIRYFRDNEDEEERYQLYLVFADDQGGVARLSDALPELWLVRSDTQNQALLLLNVEKLFGWK
ncbi:MAG: hypothetical protein KC549_04080 [Myxococcales bacterium]|nr:hypothetical protein [Myxococcales bacterium]MCB9545792.1 hypothetical protein [Myxococcales bacterium]